MKILKQYMELIGLAGLLSFTATDVALAILAKGALIYYYETNRVIWVFEIAIGLLAIVICLIFIKRTLDNFPISKKRDERQPRAIRRPPL